MHSTSFFESVFGIRSTAPQWFQSYLLDRNQFVVVILFPPLLLWYSELYRTQCNNQIKFNEETTAGCLSSWVVDTHKRAFSNKVRTLSFILDPNTIRKQVVKIYQAAYNELKRISSIHSYLAENAAEQLVSILSRSHFYYCSSFIMGAPKSLIQPMQEVLNRFYTPYSHTAHVSYNNVIDSQFMNESNVKLLACVTTRLLVYSF